MTLSPECVVCFYTQSLKAAQEAGLDALACKEVLDEVGALMSVLSWEEVPVEVAPRVYEMIIAKTGTRDLYARKKADSILMAQQMQPILRLAIEESHDPLLYAAKAAVLGNIIDYGVDREFDLALEAERIFETHFVPDGFDSFRLELERAERLLYIGDNAGENIFDELFIEAILKERPELQVTYLARGAPIINDVTLEDLASCAIHDLAEVLSSGVPTPGFVRALATPLSLERFDAAHLIISKGMGNYEALSEQPDPRVFYFLKVKCGVVARHIGAPEGSMVCARGRS